MIPEKRSNNSKMTPLAPMPFLLLLVSFIMVSNLYAAGISLTWNANKEADLARYKVYNRLLPTNEYGSPIFSDLPDNPSAPQFTVNNLNTDTSYGFITTAFDTSGNESVPSTEKQITTDGGGETFPPPIATPAPGSSLTSSSETFTGDHTTSNDFYSSPLPVGFKGLTR